MVSARIPEQRRATGAYNGAVPTKLAHKRAGARWRDWESRAGALGMAIKFCQRRQVGRRAVVVFDGGRRRHGLVGGGVDGGR